MPKPSEPKEATPRPWKACRGGECPCVTIWCADYPIAKIESGKWGDSYPALKVTEDRGICGSVTITAETELIDYGTVFPETAKANVKLIVEAVNSYDALRAVAEAAREYLRLQSEPRVEALFVSPKRLRLALAELDKVKP